MSSILLIVESPTKAKTLSKYLGKEYKILSSFGHMFDLDTSKAMWGIDIKNNFNTFYSLLQDKKNQLENINKAAKEVDLILTNLKGGKPIFGDTITKPEKGKALPVKEQVQ